MEVFGQPPGATPSQTEIAKKRLSLSLPTAAFDADHMGRDHSSMRRISIRRLALRPSGVLLGAMGRDSP